MIIFKVILWSSSSTGQLVSQYLQSFTFLYSSCFIYKQHKLINLQIETFQRNEQKVKVEKLIHFISCINVNLFVFGVIFHDFLIPIISYGFWIYYRIGQQNKAFDIYQPPNPCFILDKITYQFEEFGSKVDIQISHDIIQIWDSFFNLFPPTSLHNLARIHNFWVSAVFLFFWNFRCGIEIMFICDNPTIRTLILSPNCSDNEGFRSIAFNELLDDIDF